MNGVPSIRVNQFRAAGIGVILALLLNAGWSAATAAPVTAQQAAAAVTGWLGVDPAPLGETLGKAVQSVDTFNDAAGNPLYYIAHLAPSGFVIVAADDLVEPIIGFAPTGKYDPATGNPLGALVNNDLSARVAGARQTPTSKSALLAQTKWRQLAPKGGGPVATPMGLTTVSDVRIAPLTQTTWDQQTAAAAGTTACYNYYTPPYGDGNVNNYPAGCVATTMAQLMRYYQFPTSSVGTASFTITNNGSAQTYNLKGGNGSGGAYVWSNMPLVPSATPSTTQCQAIGALVADAGATVGMAYAADGSSSILTDAKTALVTTFHYSSGMRGWHNNNDITASLPNMINPNLDAHYPVLLGIRYVAGVTNIGHAVVVDGYGYSTSTLYHHLNLGWSGADTAWYSLPNINTSAYTFNVVDGCVYNTYTNGTGEIISGRVLDQIARPVVGATVSATRTGGGTYTTTTDSQGIYALARIPSASSYAISISKANYTSVSTNVATGTSLDSSLTCGNVWGVNLTMNMQTTVLDHLVWGALTSPQALNAPFGVNLTAQNLTNGLATGFSGPVTLSAYAAGLGSSTTIIGSLATNGYVYGFEMTIGYAFTPSTNLQVSAVRSYATDKVSVWTDTGTLLGSQSTSLSGSWGETTLTTPITLSAGTTYRVSAHVPDGADGYYNGQHWPTTFANGTVGQSFYYSSGDSFPSTVYTTGIGALVDLRYAVAYTNAIPLSPTTSGAFVNAAWNGSLTVSQNATNVTLKADDGAGHTAVSTPFNVITAMQLKSPKRLAGGQFQFTVLSAPGQHLEILASSNLASWASITSIINTAGTTNLTDGTAGLSKRYYRAHQLP